MRLARWRAMGSVWAAFRVSTVMVTCSRCGAVMWLGCVVAVPGRATTLSYRIVVVPDQGRIGPGSYRTGRQFAGEPRPRSAGRRSAGRRELRQPAQTPRRGAARNGPRRGGEEAAPAT